MEDGRLLDRLSGLGFASAVAISHDDRYLAIEDFRAGRIVVVIDDEYGLRITEIVGRIGDAI